MLFDSVLKTIKKLKIDDIRAQIKQLVQFKDEIKFAFKKFMTDGKRKCCFTSNLK